MSKLLAPRAYQLECIQAIHTRWDGGDNRVPSVLATGLGKTVIFSHLGDKFLEKNTGRRVLVIAHTDELIQQAYKGMRNVAPHLSVGIVQGARYNQCTAQVVVSSRQTLASEHRRNQIRNVGLIVVDECHHATRTNTYGKILEHYGAFDTIPHPDSYDDSIAHQRKVLVAGFTATLIRGDKAKLSEVWQPGPVFKRDIHFGIRHGYLLDVKGRRVKVPDLNLRDVKKTGGEYQDASLADELERAFAPEIVAKAYVEHASERLGIGFAPTVESAEVFAAAFREAGITSEVIHGKLSKGPRGERAAMLRRLHTGETRMLWGCMVLTEGFDEPRVSCVVMARPTTLPGLYQQCVGRALRPDLTLSPAERGHALILDVVGASTLHNLASLVDLSLPEDPYPEEIEDPCVVCMFWPCDCPREEKEETEPDCALEEFYVGEVEVVDFDPLARDSSHAWQKTAGGTYVLTAGPSAYVFLVEEEMPGEYGIAWCTRELSVYGFLGCVEGEPYFKTGPRCTCIGPARPGEHGVHNGAWGAWANGHRNLSMEMALAWGVDVAEELGGEAASMFGDKKKAWRKSKDVSAAQVNKARRLGITVPMVEKDGVMVPNIRKGELSDLIDLAMATKRVDPVRAALRAQVRETVNA